MTEGSTGQAEWATGVPARWPRWDPLALALDSSGGTWTCLSATASSSAITALVRGPYGVRRIDRYSGAITALAAAHDIFRPLV